MAQRKLDGLVIKIKRRGEVVEGKLRSSKYGPHYNAEWINSDGQIFIGTVEEWEIKEAGGLERDL